MKMRITVSTFLVCLCRLLYTILTRAKNEPFLLSHFQNDSMLAEGPNCIIHVVDPRDPQWGTIMWQEIRKQCGVDSRSNNQRLELFGVKL